MNKSDIIDELCSCGHSRSEHLDNVSKGHGMCAVSTCYCGKFTWSSYVYYGLTDKVRERMDSVIIGSEIIQFHSSTEVIIDDLDKVEGFERNDIIDFLIEKLNKKRA